MFFVLPLEPPVWAIEMGDGRFDFVLQANALSKQRRVTVLSAKRLRYNDTQEGADALLAASPAFKGGKRLDFPGSFPSPFTFGCI